MEMHQIRYFLAVSETLNLTRAAERCNVAQPSLTCAIKALETELGGELLRRERALSHLTELGNRMLPMLRQCYDAALTAKTVAASLRKGEAAPLSIAVSQTVALTPLIAMVRELSRALPGLQLKLHRGTGAEVAEHLRSGAAELAIAGPLRDVWSRLDVFPLFDEPFDLIVGRAHRLAGRNRVEFRELAAETFLVDTGSELAEELKDRLAAHQMLAMATHEVATQEGVLALLEANLGIAILPIGAARGGDLRRIPLHDLDLVRRVSVYTVAGRHRALPAATLLNMLHAADWSFAGTMEAATGSH